MNDDEWPGWRAHPHAPAMGTTLCRLAEIEDGGARVVAFGGGWRGLELLVARSADDAYAYVNVCPHVALPLNIDSRVDTHDRLLYCDHHGAAFRFEDGSCVEGPCVGTSLERVPIVVRSGELVVAAGHPVPADPVVPTDPRISPREPLAAEDIR